MVGSDEACDSREKDRKREGQRYRSQFYWERVTVRPYHEGLQEPSMKLIARLERFIDVLMSFATLVGFLSTLYLVWIFLNSPPTIVIKTTSVGPQGLPINTPSINGYVIQGVPFFWIFTSLVSLSAGHTYRSAKHLILSLMGKHPSPAVHQPHLLQSQTAPTTKTSP